MLRRSRVGQVPGTIALWLALSIAFGWSPAHTQPPLDRIKDSTLLELTRTAVAHVTSRAWPEADAAFDRAIAHAIVVGEVAVEIDLLRRKAFVKRNLKDVQGERATLDRALARAVETGDRLSAGQVRNDLGGLAFRAADVAGVRQHYTAAVEEFGAANQPVLQADALRNLTFARDMSNDEREVILARAWEIARAIDNPSLQGRILHQWGDTINLQGDYARAIEKLDAARPLFERAGSVAEQANLATSMGRTWRLHGRHDRALDEYKRALALQEQSGDLRGQAQTLDAMAVAHSLSGRRREAVQLDERAVALARRSGDEALAQFFLINLADMRLELGEHSEAARIAEAVLANDLGTRAEGRIRTVLSAAYAAMGRPDDALHEADRAVALLTESNEAEFLIQALERRSRIRAANDVTGALEDARRGLDLLDGLRAKAAPRDSMKEAFVDQHRRLFSLAIELSVATDPLGALAIAERARGRAFLDLLATRDLSTATTTAAATASSPPAARDRGPAPRRDLVSTAAVAAPTADAITAIASRLQSTLVAYWVDVDATYVWVVSPDGRTTARKVPVASTRLTSLVRSLAAVGMASKPTVEQALRALDELLIAPVRAALPTPGSLVTVVPHGPLFGVSFAALRDPHGRYLIESYAVNYTPSVGVLEATIERAAGDSHQRYLLIADPTPRPSDKAGPLPALSGARREVAGVSELLPPSNVTTLVGSEATEARVRALVQGRGVIHFATHGLGNNARPFDSFLALGREGTAEHRDGRLTAAEIYGLALDVDLIVLSACRTTAGGMTGDGLIGLTRAFLYAGARSVLSTLWDLADQPADRLLTEFYRQRIRGRSKANALRAAQQSVLEALRRGEVRVQTPLGEVTLPEHPALWANLILIGAP